ncbi:DMT family transporter [Saccharopolyspora hirsuta]|uniref:DMT family transporter n=2 Tax=Saccharopolyspora hirsuta TaxID=1837 RepID=A0A5M7BBT0_SACHI|nr:DMT family transporter [Saccharopolyspora hirsuta]
MIAGAGCLSISAIVVKLAEVNAGTAAFLRCALALIALVPLAVRECRRHGRFEPGLVWCALVAGALLGADYVMWTASVLDVGAGIATVLINVQVVVFPLLARLFDRTPISARFALTCPVMLAGIALVGGALSHDPNAQHQVRGTLLALAAGAAYAGYLYLNRRSGQRSPQHVVTPVCLATASAAAVAGLLGWATTGVDLDVPPASWLWLAVLALISQVAAFLLMAAASPELAPNTSASLLLLQPVLAVALGVVVLAETPAPSQLVGCAVVVAAVWFAGRNPRHESNTGSG